MIWAFLIATWLGAFLCYIVGYALGVQRGHREGAAAVLSLLSETETSEYVRELVETERGERARWN